MFPKLSDVGAKEMYFTPVFVKKKQTCQDAYNDVVVTFSGGVDKLAFENCPQKYKNRQNKGACCYNLHLATYCKGLGLYSLNC
ncbi:MAG: hypothetical protein IJ332_05060 [Clostridia bacterium]|nr:hypothetical protein [Clostridia bacterium]